MKVGDLVEFKPAGKLNIGTLVAIKYFERIKKQTGGLSGVILEDHGSNCSVLFGEKILIINKNHLKLI